MLSVVLPIYGLKGYYAIYSILAIALGYACLPAVIWPVLPLIVDKKYLGLAYSIE